MFHEIKRDQEREIKREIKRSRERSRETESYTFSFCEKVEACLKFYFNQKEVLDQINLTHSGMGGSNIISYTTFYQVLEEPKLKAPLRCSISKSMITKTGLTKSCEPHSAYLKFW